MDIELMFINREARSYFGMSDSVPLPARVSEWGAQTIPAASSCIIICRIFFFFVRRRICDMVDARRSAEPSPQAVVSAHEAVAAKRWYVLSVRCDHA